METALSYLINILVVTGIGLLIASLFPIRRLVRQLPEGASLKPKWRVLNGLIVFFIVGYAAYTVVHWQKKISSTDLVVPVLFFGGSVFVLLVGRLAYQTASDMKKMALLECENITDPLIGIYNRRYLDRILAEEIKRANRYGSDLSVLLLDVDFFKRINDTYGHNTGDAVLKQLGRIILDAVRETDIVARYGGEEIAIIFPETTEKKALSLAERLRRRVASTTTEAPETHSDREILITISIGIAGLTDGNTSPELLMEKADRALYAAKQAGRNRVVAWQEFMGPSSTKTKTKS
ncbi:GGDEF domain-containing protein [Desulfolithobacter sp.]